jgi:hypothetical protein
MIAPREHEANDLVAHHGDGCRILLEIAPELSQPARSERVRQTLRDSDATKRIFRHGATNEKLRGFRLKPRSSLVPSPRPVRLPGGEHQRMISPDPTPLTHSRAATH